jgi:hypothetical protein
MPVDARRRTRRPLADGPAVRLAVMTGVGVIVVPIRHLGAHAQGSPGRRTRSGVPVRYQGDCSFPVGEATGVRAILPAGLWLVLCVSGAGAVAAQIDTVALQTTARDQLEALLYTYPPARTMHFHRKPGDRFAIEGYFRTDLTYAADFKIFVVVTPKRTITFRVFPAYRQYSYLNLAHVRDPDGVMQKLLQFCSHSFFFWGVNGPLDVFAGYTFTLESGFPEEAIKVVIRSIPLIDARIGELADYIDEPDSL